MSDTVQEALANALNQCKGAAWTALAGSVGAAPYSGHTSLNDNSLRIARLVLDAARAEGRAEERARCVAVVEEAFVGYVSAYPEDVWPDAPLTDAQSATVMRLMLPRFKESTVAALTGADK